MQIEDSHRDYYDYACPHLIDKAIVYHRNSQVVLGQELFFNPNPFHIDVEKWFNRFHHQWECQTWEFGLYVGYDYYKFLVGRYLEKGQLIPRNLCTCRGACEAYIRRAASLSPPVFWRQF